MIVMLVVQGVDSAMKGEGLVFGGKDKDKFLEWTMTATVISMFLSIGADVLPFDLVYVEEKERECESHPLQPLQETI